MINFVTFIYQGLVIRNIFVSVSPASSGGYFYKIYGISGGNGNEYYFPILISDVGIFIDVTSACNCVDKIVKKYPRLDRKVLFSEIPEFDVMELE